MKLRTGAKAEKRINLTHLHTIYTKDTLRLRKYRWLKCNKNLSGGIYRQRKGRGLTFVEGTQAGLEIFEFDATLGQLS